MLKLNESRIIHLATEIREQLKFADNFCYNCETTFEDCMECTCEYRRLQNVLMSVLEELCVTNPFLLEHNDKLQMPEYWIPYCKHIIKKREEYKAKHPND